MKICNRCKEELPLSAFHKNKSSKDGLNNRCGKCTAAYNKERYADPIKRELQLAYSREYWKLNHKSKRVKKYGLTEEDYDKLVEWQCGRCAICGEPPELYLYIDHNHVTNKVRGLLCLKCNTGLGLFKDSVDNLSAAIHYLLGSS